MTMFHGKWESSTTDLAAYLSWVHCSNRDKRLLQQAWVAFVVLQVLLFVVSRPRVEPWPMWTVGVAPVVALVVAVTGRFVADRREWHRAVRGWTLGPHAVTLSSTGAVLSDPATTFTVAWDDVTYVLEAPEHLLVAGDPVCLWVPKRAFQHEEWPGIWSSLEEWNAAARSRRGHSLAAG